MGSLAARGADEFGTKTSRPRHRPGRLLFQGPLVKGRGGIIQKEGVHLKRKAIGILSFLLILVLTVSLLPISVFAMGEDSDGYTAVSDPELYEALDAYKKFTEAGYHEDEWAYTIESFGLYDLNHDGIPELFTLGGGQMDYSKIFTYKNKQVDYVHWGSSFQIYDNGIVYADFSSGSGYILYSYYTMGDDLSLELAFRFAEWYSLDENTYSVGEQAYDENSEKVPYQQVAEQRDRILGNAQIVNIVYHDNTASERNAVFTNETSVPSDSDTARFGSDLIEAYLGLLESRKQLILDSGKLFGTSERAVAIADVCGDRTPELIFAAANEDSYYRNTPGDPPEPMWSELFIYTFDNGELRQIYSCSYDFAAASGSHTRLFQSGVGKDLWIASGYGDAYWDETYTRLSYDPDKKVLLESEKYYSREYFEEDRRYEAAHDEQTISEREYTAAVEALENSAASWIISSRSDTSWDSHYYTAMTYDDAVAFLNSGLNKYTTETSFASTYGKPVVRLVNDFRFINTDSRQINWDLALTGLTLSGHVYDGKNAGALLKALGYDVVDTKSRYEEDKNRTFHPVASMGYKCVLDENGNRKNVFAVVVRGTSTELLGDIPTDIFDGAVAMFDISRGVVAGELEEFITETTGKTIDEIRKEDNFFFFTGHSMGGAVANALSVDGMVMSLCGNNKGHIYTYTFESPHTCVNLWWNNPEEMSNAFNFKNIHDGFTDLPARFGSTTYGKDMPFAPYEIRYGWLFVPYRYYPEDYWNVFRTVFPNYESWKYDEHERGNCLAYIIQTGMEDGWWAQMPIR